MLSHALSQRAHHCHHFRFYPRPFLHLPLHAVYYAHEHRGIVDVPPRQARALEHRLLTGEARHERLLRCVPLRREPGLRARHPLGRRPAIFR